MVFLESFAELEKKKGIDLHVETLKDQNKSLSVFKSKLRKDMSHIIVLCIYTRT